MNLVSSGQKGWQSEKWFLFTPTRTGARHADDGMAGHKGVKYRPVDSSKMGIAEGYQSKSTREGELTVLHALSLTRTHTDLQLLCQFGSSLPLTHNPATWSFLSKGLSVHPTSLIKQVLQPQKIPPNLSVHALPRSSFHVPFVVSAARDEFTRRWPILS